MKKQHAIGAFVLVFAGALFLYAFSIRAAIAPLHWAALWFVFIALYIALACSMRPERSIRILGPLFPVLLLAAVECTWAIYDYVDSRMSEAPNIVASPSAGKNAKLQSVVDFDYQPLTQQMEFIPDGIRVIKMPSNYRSESVNTNNLGWRGGEFGPKAKNVFRIIMLGDSGLFGWNAPSDDATIPVQLESILNDRLGEEVRFEVLNLGVPSGISNFHVPTFATYGQELDPDFVILFMGLNDLGGSNVIMPASFSQRLKRYLSIFTLSSQIKHLVRETASTLDKIARRLRSYRFIANALTPPQKNWVGDKISAQTGEQSNFDRYKKVYFRNLERIYALAAKLGIPFATLEQPSMRLGLKLGQNPSQIDLARQAGFEKDNPVVWRNQSERYEQVVSEGNALASRYGGIHFGVSGALSAHNGSMVQSRYLNIPDDAIFVTDAHYTAYGSKLIAGEIFQKLEARFKQARAAKAKPAIK